MANADDSEVSRRQAVNSEGAVVFVVADTESVQVTASSLSESAKRISRLQTGLRSKFDTDFVADYV